MVPSLDIPSVVEQQKDNLCGPFWAARILREAGIEEWAGETIDEDLIALRAGSVLPDDPAEGAVPRGAPNRTDYRFELPVVPASISGTAAGALAGAIEAAAEGALCCVPLRGPWSPERVEALVERGGDRPRRLEVLAAPAERRVRVQDEHEGPARPAKEERQLEEVADVPVGRRVGNGFAVELGEQQLLGGPAAPEPACANVREQPGAEHAPAVDEALDPFRAPATA